MTKFAGLLLLLVPLSSCAAQKVYNNEIYVENRCGQTLEMSISNSSNMHSLKRSVTSAAGSRALVASYASYGEDVIEQIQDNYSLTVTDGAGTKMIDAAQLRDYLGRVEKVVEGDRRAWTIREASVCP